MRDGESRSGVRVVLAVTMWSAVLGGGAGGAGRGVLTMWEGGVVVFFVCLLVGGVPGMLY